MLDSAEARSRRRQRLWLRIMKQQDVVLLSEALQRHLNASAHVADALSHQLRLAGIASMLALFVSPALALDNPAIADQAVTECKRIYREDSTPSHKHPCPCPDDTMANGAACGARSAYLKPGGARPICSAKDITPEIVSAISHGYARTALLDRCRYARP